MLVTLDGIVISVIGSLRKAFIPMYCAPSEIVTSANDVQFWKAFSPILVMVDGITISVRAVQLSNAVFPIS